MAARIRVAHIATLATFSLVACGGSSGATFDSPSNGDASVLIDASAHPLPVYPGAPDAAGGDPSPLVDGGDASTGAGGTTGAGGSSSSGSSSGGSSSGASSGGSGGTSSGGGVVSPATCTIGGVTYQDEDDDPANICEWCDPSESTTGWSNITDGAACGTGEACFGGVCTSNFPDCVINGVDYAPNTASPSNPCALCQPRQSETSWTNAPDGTACAGGSCFAGVCD